MKILVPIDGSVEAMKAVDFAANISIDKAENQIVILYGIPHAENSVYYFRESEEQGHEKADHAFAAVKESIGNKGLNIEYLTKVGFDPATIILEEETENKYDMIVMGSRGMNKVGKWLVGSVSSKVAKNSKLTVVLAR